MKTSGPLSFDIDEFWRFCAALTIESKEFGLIQLGDRLLGSQRYFIEEVFDALNQGIHHIVCLKGRQLGISTICLALDLYWHFKFPGTSGTLATDTEENREMFRSTLTMYMEGLPQRWRRPAKSHNRTQLVLANRSRIAYQVAGTRKNVGFGAGKALMFVHATECGKWGEGTDMTSFEASLAETNPRRLYIFESTAYGFNQFQESWETANDATTQKAIFVGWWRNELYQVSETDDEPMRQQIFRTYWDGTYTNEEQVWMAEIKALYDYDITPEQIAWWRWTLNEKMKGDEQQMYEKYPPTEDYAFIMSGSQFFSTSRLTDQIKAVKHKPFEVKRFVFGPAFDDTVLVDCNEKTATLKIWQMPAKKGQYVLGCDPAWGSSEWADRFCVSVLRCWADGMEQVAEFCTPELNTRQFAWVMLYLAGAYGDPNLQANVMINLEINGPGSAVWNEVKNLKDTAAMTKGSSNLLRILNNVQSFMYKRPDAIHGSYAYHTKSNTAEKERFLNHMKDQHEYGALVINSTACLDEMKNVTRIDGFIGAPGRGKDDRVIACALGVIAWIDFIRVRLIQMGITRAKQQADEQMPMEYQQAGRSISNYLKHVGLVPKTVQ